MKSEVLRRLGPASRIEWFLRGIEAVALLRIIAIAAGWAAMMVFAFSVMSGCASTLKTPCEFDVKVKVMDAFNTDHECRRLGARFSDNGLGIGDRHWIRGCSTKGLVVTNGSESSAGHEMKHQIERNCGVK